jgi:twitching motility protein PilU
LLGTKTIEEMIVKGKFEHIKEIMEKSENLGMRTFDSALFHLYKDGRIGLDDALANADSANNLRLRIKLFEKGETPTNDDEDDSSKSSTSSSSGMSLSLEKIEEDDPEAENNPFPDL